MGTFTLNLIYILWPNGAHFTIDRFEKTNMFQIFIDGNMDAILRILYYLSVIQPVGSLMERVRKMRIMLALKALISICLCSFGPVGWNVKLAAMFASTHLYFFLSTIFSKDFLICSRWLNCLVIQLSMIF